MVGIAVEAALGLGDADEPEERKVALAGLSAADPAVKVRRLGKLRGNSVEWSNEVTGP